MDAALPSFILGYHGCDAAVVDDVCAGRKPLRPSANSYDWLGDGIYFWEHNARRAYDFACEMARRPHPSRQAIKSPAVVGAVIHLGYCLNLLDARFLALVRQAHDDLVVALRASGAPTPRNTGGPDRVARHLDCAVIRQLHGSRKDMGLPPFDSVRAAFAEGPPLYADAGFASKNHIQVCVRDHRLIAGYFRPLDDAGKPLRFD